MPADGFDAAFQEAKMQRQPPTRPAIADDAPFTALGHDRGKFFFWTAEGKQVLSFAARDLHSAGDLAKMAPLWWWEGAFPGREGFSTKAAGDALIRASYGVGVYDPDRLRGRGVWLDDGRVVLHLGDRLLVDGVETAIPAHRSARIYEQARPLALDLADPASDDEARQLLALCQAVAWDDPRRDGVALAGWIMVSMVCGAMAWRPHLWLVSETGGGKTWVLDNLVKPLIRGLALRAQSKTTEAGIRGELGSDARPIVFDEAETQNEADRHRMQQVLDLARQASSEDGGSIIKGTREGGAKQYRIRSCFAFASVNLGLTQAADESRTLPLSIGVGSPEQFARLKALHAQVMQPGFPARLLARALVMVPAMRANAETLADAISRTGAGRRAGDTLGAVLAGALALQHGRTITPEEADRILKERIWIVAAAEEARPDPEWRRALLRLMQHQIQFVSSAGRPERASVSELIGAVVGTFGEDGIRPGDALSALKRAGMRVDQDRLMIGYRAEGVASAFRGSPWEAAWLATISRAPGSERGKPVRFGPAYVDKAVAVPVRIVMEGET